MTYTCFPRRCLLLGLLLAATLVGCAKGPRLLSTQEQKAIDRKWVEYPAGFELKAYIVNLTAPSAIAFDNQGNILVAESGGRDGDPHIFGYRADGARFEIYPIPQKFPRNLLGREVAIKGPVGGMVADHGRVYVSHRDANDRGIITAFAYDGTPTTIIADLPAAGDYGMTDLAISPNGRLFFGVGSATNSGVVGVDDWKLGWVKQHPDFCDVSWWDFKLLGYRFDSPNPRAGFFGGPEIAVTAPFQPFGQSSQTWIRKSATDKPSAAIYSVAAMGGDLRVEAHGIRYPRGLAFNEFGRMFMTNQGMELRGTRPVKDDPDVLLRLVPGTWYGWPDFSADLLPITESRFQPGSDLVSRSGYPEISSLIDHAASGLIRPDRNTLLQVAFPPLSGAAKMDFAPGSGPFKEFRGNAIVALSGDHSPFATNGQKLPAPVGFKVIRVDVDTRQVKDFIRNTLNAPGSQLETPGESLERPFDIKFGPDGALYILDMGQVQLDANGKESIVPGTGKIYKLTGLAGQ
jgi:glucose/arabinose dehydrogenase